MQPFYSLNPEPLSLTPKSEYAKEEGVKPRVTKASPR